MWLALPVHAQWFTTVGSAPIIDGDVDQAREQATQEALRQAMLQAGASVSSIQNLSNGALTRDQFQIRSNSEVRPYNLLAEEESGRIALLHSAQSKEELSELEDPLKALVLASVFRQERRTRFSNSSMNSLNEWVRCSRGV